MAQPKSPSQGTTSKGTMPWSIKGVSPEARSAAKAAAADSDLTIGQWLDQIIIGSAIGQLSDTKADLAATQARAIDEIMSDPVIAAIDRLSARVEATEQQAADAVAPLTEAIQTLLARVERLEGGDEVTAEPAPAETPAKARAAG